MGKVQKKFKPGQGYTKKDWDDVQSPELTDQQMAKAKPFDAAEYPDQILLLERELPVQGFCARPAHSTALR